MTTLELEHFKELLSQRSRSITAWLESAGFLEDGDVKKVYSLLGQIKDAIGRIENKTYGKCAECAGEVEPFRLEIQPATTVCLDCISDKEKAQLEEELFLASKIHRALLPQAVEKIEGFQVVVKSKAARTVGGDYYDFLPAGPDGTSRVVIADVMGKGLPAGLLMSNVQGALRIMAEDLDSPKMLISRVNQWFCRNVPVTKFISLACIAIKQLGQGKAGITYTNAGHCPPILIRRDGSIEILEPTGGVLGVHQAFTYEEQDIELSAGDSLVLYTDGVTEAENGSGEQFGEERLIKLMAGNLTRETESIPEYLMREVQNFTGKQELDDDFTLIVLRKI